MECDSILANKQYGFTSEERDIGDQLSHEG
jgi:hypothetical protein